MDLTGIPQPIMDWEAENLLEAWKKFQQHVDLIFNGPLTDKGEEAKINYLLLWAGVKGRDVYNTWTLTADERKSLEAHYTIFKEYVQPKQNPVFSRYKFNNEIQGANPIEQFVTKLRLLAKDCAFGEAEDEMIRDRIVFGTNSAKVREKLINEGAGLTLTKALQIVQNVEFSQQQLKTMGASQASTVSQPPSQDVHLVQRGRPRGRGTAVRSRGRGYSISYPRNSGNGDRQKKDEPKQVRAETNRRTCGNCGFNHAKCARCPARGKQCGKCLRHNHFAKMCNSVHEMYQENAEFVEYDEYCQNANVCLDQSHDVDSIDNLENGFFIDCIANVSSHVKNNEAFVTLEILDAKSNSTLDCKLDTGSQVNVLPLELYDNMKTEVGALRPSQHLSGYGGSPIKSVGTCTLNVRCRGRQVQTEFHVVDPSPIGRKAPPILGLQSCLNLGLEKLVDSVTLKPPTRTKPLDKESILKDYKDVFTGIGLFPGEVKIELDPTVQPVIHPPRRVPQVISEKLKVELDRMEKLKVITKVDTPTQWVNSLVIVEKPNGALRICLDPRDLNRAIRRPHYPMKTLNDVLPQLSEAKFFTKLDARSGYWTLKLSVDSSFLTTFNTPYGRYRFLRLPFGLKSSQDEFQRQMDTCFSDLPGVVDLVKDLLVYGKTREEHDSSLLSTLQRARECGIKLNCEKLDVGQTEVAYFGHIISSQGLKPDPKKVRAIQEMHSPTNRSELETLLGMITYLTKFAPNLSEITSPMRQLLSSKSAFIWDSAQEQAFNQVKAILTRSPGPILTYFDPKKEIILQVDASKHGLGATLLQDGKPVCYASKALTPTEISYAQIEKEMYAIVFGCQHFHQYIYERDVTVQTDHKPLVAIIQKPIHSAPARLQRMILQLQKYNLKLVHVPGKNIPVADTLSRNYLPDTLPSLSRDLDAQVHMVTATLPISNVRLEEIRTETMKDPQLVTLTSVILDGWPEFISQCPYIVREFWNFREEMTVIEQLIMKGQRIVIPTSLRPKLLDILHTGHPGIERSLGRARDTVFWPGISQQVKDTVLSCNVYLTNRNSKPKEPMKLYEIPEYPWQVVATDLFTWNEQDYVLVVDYYSRWFEVFKLQTSTSQSVISKLQETFSRYGIPEKVVSDNGPQYSSSEFRDFARKWNFTHVTSSPRYPQSNGLAERTVQTVKRILNKSKADGHNPFMSILAYRTTPLDINLSPSQLLMSRRLRSNLPTHTDHLKPKVQDHPSIHNSILKAKVKSKTLYDRSSRSFTPLKSGDPVRVQIHSKKWTPAVVVHPNDARSYTVQTTDGAMYRRNSRHIFGSRDNVLHYKPDLKCLDSPEVSNNPGTDPLTQPSTIPSSTKLERLEQKVPNPSGLYTTRSGRAIKPPDKLNL